MNRQEGSQYPLDNEEHLAHNASNGHALIPVTARGEATRRRILDAAETVFGKSGYHEASISEITKQAGVAQGTFYIYFHSKREIFIELVEDIGNRLREATREAMANVPDRLEAERLGFDAFFKFASAHRRIYTIVQEAEHVAPEIAQSYYRNISRGYIRGLQKAMEEGQIRSMNPEALAYSLMGIGHFVALRWLIWPQEGEVDYENTPQLPVEVFATIVALITKGLANPAHE